MSKLNYDQTLVSPGVPGHVHIERINRDGNGHEIGSCECGRRIDYSILQRQLPEMGDAYTQHNFNLAQVVKTLRNTGS